MILFSSCLCIHECISNHILKVVKTISYKPLVRISPNCNFGAFEDKDKLFIFSGQKVEGQVTVRPHGQISALGGIFSPVCGIHGHILMKLITITHYHVEMTWWHFQGYGFRGQGHFTTFSEMHFSLGSILIWLLFDFQVMILSMEQSVYSVCGLIRWL